MAQNESKEKPPFIGENPLESRPKTHLNEAALSVVKEECEKMRNSARFLRNSGYAVLVFVAGWFVFGTYVFLEADNLLRPRYDVDVTDDVFRKIETELSDANNETIVKRYATLGRIQKDIQQPEPQIATVDGRHPKLTRLVAIFTKCRETHALDPTIDVDAELKTIDSSRIDFTKEDTELGKLKKEDVEKQGDPVKEFKWRWNRAKAFTADEVFDEFKRKFNHERSE